MHSPLTAGLSADQKQAMAGDTRLTKDDFYTGGPAKKKAKGSGGGRHVASKAGEKRYGLPIGTPLGGTKSKAKEDVKTQQSYDTFMAADTPAELRKAASWMSTDDLTRSGEALFSFTSDNPRDEAARDVLVKELANRGIDPHTLGYTGPPVVVNPNPKKDPVARAAETAQRVVDTAQHKADAAGKKAETEAQRQKDTADAEAARAAKVEADLAHQRARTAIGDALSQGLISEAEAREKTAALSK